MVYTIKEICKCGKKLEKNQIILYAIFGACLHPKTKDKKGIK